MSTYLKIDIAIIIIPLLLSFDKKVHFYKKWKFVFPAILLPGVLFIVWDIWFTNQGVWSFNPIHLSGINIFNLPLEEHLFFLTVPYSSLFTYETIKTYWPSFNPQRSSKIILTILILILLIVGITFFERIYTSVTFLFFAVLVSTIVYIIKFKHTGRLLFSYGLIVLPFLIFNGLLTGTGLEEPVVIYNNTENLDTRILTIPVEDIFYGMILIFLNVSLFELFRKDYKEMTRSN